MNDQDITAAEGFGKDAVRLDEGHVVGQGGIPDRFENPGLPPHVPRGADLSEAAAKRAEKQVAGLFTLSILGTVLFVLAYFLVDIRTMAYLPGIGDMSLQHVLLGVGMGLALLGIGLGAVHWAKTLMPDHEVIEERHPIVSPPEERQGVLDTLRAGAESSQINRRPILKIAGGTALGIFSFPLLMQLIGGLGMGNYHRATDDLATTFWQKGMRLVTDPELRPIRASDVTLGSVFHVLPEGLLDLEHGVLEEKAKAAVILIRL